MPLTLNRRQFLSAAVASSVATGLSCRVGAGCAQDKIARPARFFFVSQGKTGLMNADGSGLRYFQFDVPNQATWQPCGVFSDGRRALFLSMEPRRDGPGRPFEEYYTQTPTHLWIHDLDSGQLTEIATQNRLAVFYTPQLLIGDARLLVQVVRNRVGQIFSMNLDGTDAREFTRAGEGLPYGFSLSPDGRRVAFHLASPAGYQIWTSDTEGGHRALVASHPEHLYFAPAWSPDAEWLAYQDCHYQQDPGHDWSDVCVSRPDGKEQRLLTQGQAAWFGATYGPPANRGGGSNTLAWTRDGGILFSRRLPGSRVPWEFQPQRPDTDHFNRDFKPEQARGGTEICRMDPRDGSLTRLTRSEPPVWDFPPASRRTGGRWSSAGRRQGTCRRFGSWTLTAEIRPQLSKGLDDRGADHPRWIPQAS